MKPKEHCPALYVSVFVFIALDRLLGPALAGVLVSAGVDPEAESGTSIIYWSYQAFRGLLAFALGLLVSRWELVKPIVAGLYFASISVVIQLYRDYKNDELPSAWDDWVFGIGFLLFLLSLSFAAGMFIGRRLGWGAKTPTVAPV
jgi:hypothetical protein